MKITEELYLQLKELGCAMLDDKGREINDPNPMFKDVTPSPVSIKEQIQRLMRVELSAQADAQEKETFEEANDLEIEDEFGDMEPDSIHTMKEEIPEERELVNEPEILEPGEQDTEIVSTEPVIETMADRVKKAISDGMSDNDLIKLIRSEDTST